MEHYTPVCKKCLLKDLSSSENDLVQAIQIRIASIPETQKTAPVLYEQRLIQCQNCDMLSSAMCRKCGCYAELRAAYRNNSCPHEDPRW